MAGLVVALEVHGLEGGGGGDGRGAGQPGEVDPVVAGQAFVPLFEQAGGFAGVGVAQRGGGLGPQRARQALAVLVPQEAAHAFHLALVDEPRQHQLPGCRAEGRAGLVVEAEEFAQQRVGRVAGVLAAGEAQAGQAAHLVELLGCRFGLRGAALLPQQGLAQAPGAVGVAVLFEGVGVGQHPQKVVPVLAQARRVVTVEGPLWAGQGLPGGGEGVVQAFFRGPGVFVAGQQAAQGGGVVAVDEHPQQGLAHAFGLGLQGERLLVIGRGCGAPAGELVMAPALGEEAGVLFRLAQLGRGELAEDTGDVGFAAGLGVEVEHALELIDAPEAPPGPLGHRAGGGGVGCADEVEVAGEFGFGGVVEIDDAAEAVAGGGVVFDEGGELGVEPPEGLVVAGGAGPGAVEGGEGFAAAAFAHQQGDEALGPARVGPEARLEAAEGGDGELDLAGPFGELFEGFEHRRRCLAAGAGLQEGEGVAGAPEALVGVDDGAEARQVEGALPGVPFEGGDQGFVVGEAGGEAQHRLPGFAAAVAAGQQQPLVEGDAGLAVPFGDLGEALAPGEVVGPLAHRRVGHPEGVGEVAVAQEGVVGEAVDAFVEGQAEGAGRTGRCCRGGAGGGQQAAVEAGLGELPATQLVEQRQAEHAAGEAVGHVRPVAGAGQHHHGVEGLGVVGQIAEFALGGGDGFVEEVAGLQGVQGREVVLASGGQPGGALAGHQVEGGGAPVVARVEHGAGGFGVPAGVEAGAGAPGEGLDQPGADLPLAEGEGVGGDAHRHLLGPGLGGEFVEALDHRLVQGRPQRGGVGQPRPGFAVAQPVAPVGVGPQARVGAVEERAQGGPGGVGFVAGELLAGQGEAQLGVVRVGAQQVGQVGDGEQVAAPGFDGPAFEGGVGHHQHEGGHHHHREHGEAAGGDQARSRVTAGGIEDRSPLPHGELGSG